INGIAIRAAITRKWRDVRRSGYQGSRGAGPEQRFAGQRSGAEACAMEAVPERERLETARRCARKLDGHLVCVGAPCRKEHFRQIAGRDLSELFGKRDGLLASIATRRERQLLHLLGDSPLQARVAITDVMDVVAVEIHVTQAGDILDPNALGLCNGVEA